MGLLYGSLLFANTMKMLGTMDEKLKNHLIFRLCPENGQYFCFPCYNRGYYQMDGSGISYEEEKIDQDKGISGGANADEE
ncbi:MAG: hypothetical protein C5S38_01555 [Candidatus Methanophagaceae archaeon]|nr:MAG: hypothetical protein C5S38_01555 [Methanophagales archaeon]